MSVRWYPCSRDPADEFREMAAYYGKSEKYDEVCEWYDGYRFSNTDIFNPWSVVNYFSSKCEPRTFWLSTGSSDIIGEVMNEADDEICQKLTSLVNGGSFTTYIDTSVIFPQIKNNPSSLYSFLLVAGYLKDIRSTVSISGNFMCEVALPNKEISFVYRKEILQKFENMIPQSTSIAVQEAIFSGDGKKLREIIQKLLIQSVSSFDTAKENFYHGFMLGICALLGGSYTTSNRESGEGRYDIQLSPEVKTLPGIIIRAESRKRLFRERTEGSCRNRPATDHSLYSSQDSFALSPPKISMLLLCSSASSMKSRHHPAYSETPSLSDT